MKCRALMPLLVAVFAGLLPAALENQVHGEGARMLPTLEASSDGTAQAGDAKQVDILTADKVELKGKYYPGQATSPCVLLLHALGDSCSNKEWTNFAKKLHEKGYAVLMFDFRGHGDSTTVRPGSLKPSLKPEDRGFWDEMANRQYVKGFAANKRPTEIKYEQFLPAYATFLANDIAAAKGFLDDQPDCNSSNLVLIGAQDGATLGALWLNSECHRFRYVAAAPGQPESLDRQNPEALAVKAAVWLTLSNTLGTSKTPLNLPPMFDWPVRGWKLPTVFAYGEGDSSGGDIAKKTFDKLIPAKIKKDYPNTEALKIAGAEGMTGKNLLLESLDTTDKILKYLEDSPESKLATKARKMSEETFFWELTDAANRVQRVVARKKGADHVEFAAYASFLR
jgi:pimeloyl-ACP methyl ester carboxylesterase